MDSESRNLPDPDEPLGLTPDQRTQSDISDAMLSIGIPADLIGAHLPPSPSTVHNLMRTRRSIG